MIIVEIYALQWERHMELKVDPGISAKELCRCIARLTGDDVPGYLISSTPQGVIPEDGQLADYGLVTGSVLMYVSVSGMAA